MGKRAQLKRMAKQPQLADKKSVIRSLEKTVRGLKHPYVLVGIVAFVLVVGYPVFTNSVWYKQHVAHVSAEDLKVISATQATIETEKGTIVFELQKKDAPKTTENFIRLASRGYYNNLIFHRVEEGFVVQGGDPKGDGTGGESAFGKPFADEINPVSPLYHGGYKEGSVAMANSGPNTNGSQFFITLADQPNLPPSYTIFGRVTSGMDAVKKIVKGDHMIKVEVK